MKKDKLYLIIIGVLVVLVISLIILNLLNTKKDSYTCTKNINLNGLEYENKFMFNVGDYGQALNLKEENIYNKLTDDKYKTLMDTVYVNSDGTLTNFKCDDTYDKNKKVICNRKVEFYKINDFYVTEGWYIDYIDELEENGYMCK